MKTKSKFYLTTKLTKLNKQTFQKSLKYARFSLIETLSAGEAENKTFEYKFGHFTFREKNANLRKSSVSHVSEIPQKISGRFVNRIRPYCVQVKDMMEDGFTILGKEVIFLGRGGGGGLSFLG